MRQSYEIFGNGLNVVSGKAQESGEGRWTVETANKLGVPVNVIRGSLEAREQSQMKANYQGKVIQALRNRFGGHEVKDISD